VQKRVTEPEIYEKNEKKDIVFTTSSKSMSFKYPHDSGSIHFVCNEHV